MEELDNTAQELIDRYIDGTESPRENNIVEHALRRYADGKKVVEDDLDLQAISVDTFQKVHQLIRPRKVRIFSWRLPIAAAILVSLGIGVFLYVGKKDLGSVEIVAGKDVAPGKVGATLTLANGKKILLSGAANGELAKEAGVVISKSANGELVYQIKGSAGSGNALAQVNTLSTSNGETYQVVLPDQSRVWMNAASSLRYSPALASLDKREVELEGEAYFEVAKDKLHPFIVRSKLQSVEVLGTHFNIKAYGNEGVVRTTLLEGSVKLDAGSGSKVLKPGEQGVFVGGEVSLKDVDTEAAVAWKNGKFMFDNDRLEDIMRQVSRWYDVEVVYSTDSLKDQAFWGSVGRFGKVSEVLKVLQRTGKVSFKLEGRKIYVSQAE